MGFGLLGVHHLIVEACEKSETLSQFKGLREGYIEYAQGLSELLIRFIQSVAVLIVGC